MCDLTPLHASEHLHTQYMLIPGLLIPAFLRYSSLPVGSIVFLNAPPEFSRDAVWKRQSFLWNTLI